jgi:hypothetical protein
MTFTNTFTIRIIAKVINIRLNIYIVILEFFYNVVFIWNNNNEI